MSRARVEARTAARRSPAPRPLAIAPGLLWHAGCHCPGCGQRQWHVGRVTAECAACGTPLIIAQVDGLAHLKGSSPCRDA